MYCVVLRRLVPFIAHWRAQSPFWRCFTVITYMANPDGWELDACYFILHCLPRHQMFICVNAVVQNFFWLSLGRIARCCRGRRAETSSCVLCHFVLFKCFTAKHSLDQLVQMQRKSSQNVAPRQLCCTDVLQTDVAAFHLNIKQGVEGSPSLWKLKV